MAISRYSGFDTIIDERTKKPRLESFPPITARELKDDVNDIIIEYKDGERLDTLAFNYLGDGRFWWAICLLNDIHLPFGPELYPGRLLRIPTNISRILNIIQSKKDVA